MQKIEPEPEPVVEKPKPIKKEIGDDPFNVVASFNKGDLVKLTATDQKAHIHAKYKDENDQVCYDIVVVADGKAIITEFVPEYQLEKVEK